MQQLAQRCKSVSTNSLTDRVLIRRTGKTNDWFDLMMDERIDYRDPCVLRLTFVPSKGCTRFLAVGGYSLGAENPRKSGRFVHL